MRAVMQRCLNSNAKKTWCIIPCTQFDGSKSLRVSSYTGI